MLNNAASINKKVLIITPVWNQLFFTKQYVESLQEFTDKSLYHLVLINNGSTDGTKEYLNQTGLLYNNISIIHNENNEGWTGAINDFLFKEDNINGINCQYILLANNDILFEKDWLSKMLKRFDDPKVGIVGPTSDYVCGLQTISLNMLGLKTEETRLLVGFFFMARKKVWEQVGQFDEKTFLRTGGGEEFDFCIRARNIGWKLVIARDVFIKHFGSKSLTEITGGGPGSAEYNQYCEDKDALLVKKWGKDALTFNVGPDRLKILGCVPLRGEYSGHKLFWMSLLTLLSPGRFQMIECTRAMVADARNLMVQKVLELGCTHVLFTDDDHVLPQDALMRLLEHDVDIVGALAFGRKKPYNPCVYNAFTLAGNEISLTSVDLIKQGLQQVTAIGFSFVLVKIDVFKQMPFPWFVYGDKSLGIHDKLGGLGEDLSFCIKAGNAGYKIHCDTDLVVPHIGDPIIVDENTYLNHKKENMEKEAKTEISVDGGTIMV